MCTVKSWYNKNNLYYKFLKNYIKKILMQCFQIYSKQIIKLKQKNILSSLND